MKTPQTNSPETNSPETDRPETDTKTNAGIGWHFPPTGGGVSAGFNNSGIATFQGNKLNNLCREIIQNSMDNALANDEPVVIDFRLEKAKAEDIGATELAKSVKACIREAKEAKVSKRDMSKLTKMQEVLQQDTITCLAIRDSNTTGLKGKHWNALVKQTGVSEKSDSGAGGSQGVGKHAPFVVSDLRTVFYLTQFKEGAQNISRFQGKSILMSHHVATADGENELQDTGFFGIKTECQHLEGHDIPAAWRKKLSDKNWQGTNVLVVAFETPKEWEHQIVKSVIQNFFYALQHDRLKITFSGDNKPQKPSIPEISSATLATWFDRLLKLPSKKDTRGDNQKTESEDENEDEGDSEGGTKLRQSRKYWELVTSKSQKLKNYHDIPGLGKICLWIRTSKNDNMPNKVAIIRKTGMLITTNQEHLRQFQGCKPFAAVCVLEDDKGNELLRNMENQTHDQFEPDRLPEGDQEKGKKALRELVKWIRTTVNEVAKPKPTTAPTDIEELSKYLPDTERDKNQFDAYSGFGTKPFVALKEFKYKQKVLFAPDDETLPEEDEIYEPDSGGNLEPNNNNSHRGGGRHSHWHCSASFIRSIYPNRHKGRCYQIHSAQNSASEISTVRKRGFRAAGAIQDRS